MNDLALLVRLQARVTAFLAELPTDQLIALAEGRASLAVLHDADVEPVAAAVVAQPTLSETLQPARPAPAPRSRKPAPKAGSVDAETVVAQLLGCKTVDEATASLAAFKLGVIDLRLVAKELNISPGGKKAELEKRILNLTVGARSKHAGLRQG